MASQKKKRSVEGEVRFSSASPEDQVETHPSKAVKKPQIKNIKNGTSCTSPFATLSHQTVIPAHPAIAISVQKTRNRKGLISIVSNEGGEGRV